MGSEESRETATPLTTETTEPAPLDIIDQMTPSDVELARFVESVLQAESRITIVQVLFWRLPQLKALTPHHGRAGFVN